MSLDNSFSDHRWGPGKPFFARKPQETLSSLQDGRSSGTSACLGSVRLHFEGNGTIISRQGRYGQRSPCTQHIDLHRLLAHQFQTYPSWFHVQLWTSWILGSWLLSFEYINHSKFHQNSILNCAGELCVIYKVECCPTADLCASIAGAEIMG